MTEHNAFEPEWTNPPGYTIFGILERRELRASDFAWEMDIPEADIDALCDGRLAIDEAIANRLEKVLGIDAEFWLVREAHYRADIEKLAARVPEAEARNWLRELPTKDMKAAGWIAQTNSRTDELVECLRFFDVSSVAHYERRLESHLGRTRLRTSASFKSNAHSLGAWLRYGELEAQHIACEAWNPDGLRKLLPELRKLTLLREKAAFLPRLKSLCASVGVAVVVAKAPKGCRASGATMFLSETKAMLLLSFRHLSDDHFWFSFFHECGHLLLHEPNMIVVEGESDPSDPLEIEANKFAEDVLIPAPWKQLLDTLKPNRGEVLRFAVRAGISPGIVVGQLENRGRIKHNFLSYLKRRYKW